MAIYHGDSTEHGPNYTQKPLVSPGQEQIVIADLSILEFLRMTINRSLLLGGETFYGKRCKSVFIYNILTEIANNFLNAFH